ncbi:APC family permease [Brevibacillus sp. B_LB10_24]|uniref:APC family permease n=1 Tax=Brevibacillus sp. B_LB10_24 TaxID=3380645 RepID=UPI0038BBC846
MRTAELKRSLKLWHIVVIGLGYMAPMAVFDTFGIVSEVTDGHVPAAYIMTLAALLFTASSYGKMVKVFPRAGSAYTYASRTINPYIGFMVGWSSLLDYLFLPMINALLTKIYLSAAFPEVPGWVLIVSFVIFITLLNLCNVSISTSVNALLVFFQFAVVAIFVLLAIRGLSGSGGTGHAFPVEPFYSSEMSFSGLLMGASILCFSFLGFDAVTTLTEETVRPEKTIGRGVFLITLLGGALFITASYFSQVHFPDVSVFEDPEGASPEISLAIGGKLFQSVFLAAALTSTLASGITSQISASRLLYAMGRDNILPGKWFGYVHPRTNTPVFNVVLIGLVSLAALFLDLLTATSFINFGALAAFTFVNISVIAYYIFRKKLRSPGAIVRYLLVPLIGSSFVLFLWFHLEPASVMVGLIWNAAGLLYLLYLTKFFFRKPPQFEFRDTV